MQRVIFAWELGGGAGHLWRLLPVAEALRARAVRVLFAVSDMVSATRLIGGRGFDFVQAPKPAPSSVAISRLMNYADILTLSGFDTPVNLAGLVNGWLGLFRIFGADCLLADHAPSALVAAKTVTLPTVVVGGGFAVPPATHPSPTFRIHESVHPGRLLAADERVLSSINAVLDASEKPRIQRVADLFAGAQILVSGYPEMDHYGPRQGVRYIGSLGVQTEGENPRWPNLPGPKVFAYLHTEESVRALVSALKQAGRGPAIIVWPEIGTREVVGQGERVHITANPVRLDDAMRDADLVVTEATSGTMAFALKHRKRMILLPRTAEQFLLAHRVAKEGLARWVDSETAPYGLAELLEEVYDAPGEPPAVSMADSSQDPVEAVVSALMSARSRT